MASFIKYVRESVGELRKVTWPTRKDLVNHTLLVSGISLLVMAVLTLLDYGFAAGYRLILEKLTTQ